MRWARVVAHITGTVDQELQLRNSLPAQNGLRFHNQQRITPIAEPSTCQNPKAPISVAQPRPRMPTLQHR